MPHFSLFTPFGHLEFSREPAEGEKLFDAGRASLGGGYNIARGERTFAWLYAWSMVLATTRQLLRRAGDQWHPERTWEFLSLQERERGVVPRAGQTTAERRAELARRRRLPITPSRTNIENTLRDAIGDVVVALVPTAKADAALYPENLGDAPMLLRRQSDRRALGRTLAPAPSGSGVVIAYEPFADGVEAEFMARDTVVIDPDGANVERVQITATGTDGSGNATLTVTKTKPHMAGVPIVLAPFPYWTSSKRHSLLILDADAAEDPETRRKAHEVLERMMRAVSTWDIAADNGDGATAGPFKVAAGKINVTPIGYIEV